MRCLESAAEESELTQVRIRKNSMINGVEIWNMGPPDNMSITLTTRSQT